MKFQIIRLVLLIFVSVPLSLFGLSVDSSAAVIKKSNTSNCVLELTGEIVSGDLKQLIKKSSEHFKGVNGESSAADVLCLDSPGGSLTEGVKIAEYVYKNGIGTVVGEKAECYSMCAIIFMMGIAQGDEVKFVNRKLHVKGKLGFHRPYLVINSSETIDAKVLALAYNAAAEDFSKVMILANNRVPWSNSTMIKPDLVQAMLRHVGNDFFMIDTVDKLGRFEIEPLGLSEKSPFESEDAYYVCENSFHWQVGLLGRETDFMNFKQNMSGSGQEIVRPIVSNGPIRLFEVISDDAGESQAGCLVGFSENGIYACGYNAVQGVSIGNGDCSASNFESGSRWISPIHSYKPSLKLEKLGQ
jgi:hypothetical protein